MAKIIEHLKSSNAYPVPSPVFSGAALRWDVDLQAEMTKDTLKSKGYNLCRAEVLEWMAKAPNISQGGQNYSFSEEERKQFRNEAQSIRIEFGENEGAKKTLYGYKGSRL